MEMEVEECEMPIMAQLINSLCAKDNASNPIIDFFLTFSFFFQEIHMAIMLRCRMYYIYDHKNSSGTDKVSNDNYIMLITLYSFKYQTMIAYIERLKFVFTYLMLVNLQNILNLQKFFHFRKINLRKQH